MSLLSLKDTLNKFCQNFINCCSRKQKRFGHGPQRGSYSSPQIPTLMALANGARRFTPLSEESVAKKLAAHPVTESYRC